MARVSSTRMTVFSPWVAGKVLTRRSILPPFEHHVDPPVLRQAPLADVHRAHDLDAAGDGAQQVLGDFQRFVQAAVDAVADPHAAFGRLDVDVAGPLLHRVEDDVVHQADHRRLAGDLLHVADVLDGLLDQRHVGRFRVFDDVVDHEDLGVRQRGDHPPDVFRAGGDDLHLLVRRARGSRRSGTGSTARRRRSSARRGPEQRQHEVLLDVLPRQDVDDFRVRTAGRRAWRRARRTRRPGTRRPGPRCSIPARRGFRPAVSSAPPASAFPGRTASRRA